LHEKKHISLWILLELYSSTAIKFFERRDIYFLLSSGQVTYLAVNTRISLLCRLFYWSKIIPKVGYHFLYTSLPPVIISLLCSVHRPYRVAQLVWRDYYIRFRNHTRKFSEYNIIILICYAIKKDTNRVLYKKL